ncbi:MAG: VanW family protein [Lachnospiraceae bacterium]|nr:VanW family protein [Lachnospiraceae bacterium]
MFAGITSGSLYHRLFRVATVGFAVCLGAAVFLGATDTARAKKSRGSADEPIPLGIYIGPVDVGGLTAMQAKNKVEAFLEEAGGVRLTLKGHESVDDQGVTPRALGLVWTNPEVIDDAFDYGRRGNAVKRYKELKDLEYQTRELELKVTLDEALVDAWLDENAVRYEQKAVNYELHRVDGAFTVTSGQSGQELDKAASKQNILRAVSEGWNFGPTDIELAITVQEPRGSESELRSVQDLLGTYTTSYKSSGKARCANVENGCRLSSDVTVYPGEEFSVLGHITPFTEANGYQLAASYLSGQVVDSLGGGICQVSTTLYNAVLLAELDVTERHNHSMIVSYVSPSADAAIAESSGKDFRFVNNTDTPVYIEGITGPNKTITFNIYGKETRDPKHKVKFESETLEIIQPDGEVINANASLPAGEVSVQSAHIGYKAQLWKVVTEDGEQVSREVINKSSYQMVPRTATVGTATSDPAAAERIAQAIATGSIDQVKAVADAVRAGAALPVVTAPPAPEPQAQPAEAPPQEQPAAE